MSFERKANYIVEQATVLSKNVTTWADFAAQVFGHKDGLVAKTFTDETERQLFYDSEQYKAVSALRARLIKKYGATNGATPEKSGRMLLRLPKSLHRAIEVEAKKEGVSLNQLAVSKLAIPLGTQVGLSVTLVAEAYTRVFDGYSSDRVVVDPELNPLFLGECRKLGLNETDYALNHLLMDIRKSKKVELPPATKRTEFRDYDSYQFASEIAVRLLQRSDGVTLDQILCDPAMSFRFDDIAKRMAPNQPVLKLRWAALNLRKTRRLGPMKPTSGYEVDLVPAGPFRLLTPSDLPGQPGVYSFYDCNRPLFAGETENLEHRIRLHLAGSMPNWLGLDDDMDCILKYSPMPTAKSKEREAWLLQFINEERPLLNYQRAA